MTGQAATRTGPWSDLRLRMASAVVLLPVVLLCIWFGGLPWLVLLALGLVLLVYEFLAMCRRGDADWSFAAAGLAYITLAALGLYWLRADPIMGRSNLMFLLVVVWASDIGAYLAGRWFGGPRLAPAISPGKTWSGAIGGLAVAAAAGLAAALVWPHGHWTAAMALAIILAVASQAGDLLESWAKRWCNVKDSGRLIPGHGGLLDRVDGVLLAAIVAVALDIWLGRGIVLWS